MNRMIILTIVMITLMFIISCSKDEPKDEVTRQARSESPSAENTSSQSIMGEQSLTRTISLEAIEEANRIFPAYPNSTVDLEKGSYTKTDFSERYNVVYKTDDSTSQVFEYFKSNVSEEYLTMISPPENTNWIELYYSVEGLNQEGKIFIWRSDDCITEIVYELERKLR